MSGNREWRWKMKLKGKIALCRPFLWWRTNTSIYQRAHHGNSPQTERWGGGGGGGTVKKEGMVLYSLTIPTSQPPNFCAEEPNHPPQQPNHPYTPATVAAQPPQQPNNPSILTEGRQTTPITPTAQPHTTDQALLPPKGYWYLTANNTGSNSVGRLRMELSTSGHTGIGWNAKAPAIHHFKRGQYSPRLNPYSLGPPPPPPPIPRGQKLKTNIAEGYHRHYDQLHYAHLQMWPGSFQGWVIFLWVKVRIVIGWQCAEYVTGYL